MVATSLDLYSLTYTSHAAPGLQARDVDEIHRAALTYNPLDGVTGILLFNGDAFLQIIEGAETAIDDLYERLLKDRRHDRVEARDRRKIEKRFFPQWSMYRLDISNSLEDSRASLENNIAKRVDRRLRDVVDQSLAAISKPTTSD